MRFKTNVRIFRGRINLAPLVDVMFILMIFLLISTSYDFQPGFLAGTDAKLELDLPEHKAPLVRGDKMVVVLTSLGKGGHSDSVIFFNNEEVSWDKLEVKLADKIHDRSLPDKNSPHSENHPPTLSLKAHGDILYKDVMRIHALASKLNVRVNMVTNIPKAEKP